MIGIFKDGNGNKKLKSQEGTEIKAMSKEYLKASSFSQIEELGNIFDIPVASESQQVWFIRTSGGDYYDDFRFNNYVAIGWDKIPSEWIIRKTMVSEPDDDCTSGNVSTINETETLLALSEKEFKNKVSDLYPEEKRPGLVYGQLNTFYNVMRAGDWIVIPSKSTQDLTIGVLGNVLHGDIEKRNIVPENEYVICKYTHKRSVDWQRELPASYDVYLQKSLRAQQTISNITEISGLVFRHLYPVYVVKNEVRITFQKTTEGELNVVSNMSLIGSVIDIAEQIARLYKVKPFVNDFTMKTAVGSPGIIELIIPMSNSSAPMVLGAIMLWLLIGKYDSEKGVSSGLNTIFNMVNKHLNDKKERELKDAEIREKDAYTQVKIAEAAKIRAETEKIKAETEMLKKQSKEAELELKTDRDGQMVLDTTPPLKLMDLIEPSDEEIQASIVPIAENCIKCAEAAKASGIRTGNN